MNVKQSVMENQRANRLSTTFYTSQRPSVRVDFPALDKTQKKRPPKIEELSKVYGRKDQNQRLGMLYQPPPQRANQRLRNGFIQYNKKSVQQNAILGSSNPIIEESRQSLRESDMNDRKAKGQYEAHASLETGNNSDFQTSTLQNQGPDQSDKSLHETRGSVYQESNSNGQRNNIESQEGMRITAQADCGATNYLNYAIGKRGSVNVRRYQPVQQSEQRYTMDGRRISMQRDKKPKAVNELVQRPGNAFITNQNEQAQPSFVYKKSSTQGRNEIGSLPLANNQKRERPIQKFSQQQQRHNSLPHTKESQVQSVEYQRGRLGQIRERENRRLNSTEAPHDQKIDDYEYSEESKEAQAFDSRHYMKQKVYQNQDGRANARTERSDHVQADSGGSVPRQLSINPPTHEDQVLNQYENMPNQPKPKTGNYGLFSRTQRNSDAKMLFQSDKQIAKQTSASHKNSEKKVDFIESERENNRERSRLQSADMQMETNYDSQPLKIKIKQQAQIAQSHPYSFDYSKKIEQRRQLSSVNGQPSFANSTNTSNNLTPLKNARHANSPLVQTENTRILRTIHQTKPQLKDKSLKQDVQQRKFSAVDNLSSIEVQSVSSANRKFLPSTESERKNHKYTTKLTEMNDYVEAPTSSQNLADQLRKVSKNQARKLQNCVEISPTATFSECSYSSLNTKAKIERLTLQVDELKAAYQAQKQAQSQQEQPEKSYYQTHMSILYPLKRVQNMTMQNSKPSPNKAKMVQREAAINQRRELIQNRQYETIDSNIPRTADVCLPQIESIQHEESASQGHEQPHQYGLTTFNSLVSSQNGTRQSQLGHSEQKRRTKLIKQGVQSSDASSRKDINTQARQKKYSKAQLRKHETDITIDNYAQSADSMSF